MARLRLSGPQILQLRDQLNAAFVSLDTFDELLLRLDRTVSNYASSSDTLPAAILKTVRHANAELWWRDLLREASNAVPDPQLRAFSDEVGFAPDFVAADQASAVALKGRELELKIEESGTTKASK